MRFSHADLNMMNRALALASQGEGFVEPNPMVGALIADGRQVLGAGYHRAFGQPHAEVNALADCRSRGHDPAGMTMYVTLEPCCHHGKTPPCTQAIIEAGLRRVVIAMRDPYHEVAGKGIAALEAAGIEVAVGAHEAQARALNAPFIKRVTQGLPWVIVKWAQTLDGKIATATGDSQWISSSASRRVVHELRGRVDAVATGMGTVLADDPSLTARGVELKRVARRIVVGRRADVPAGAKLLVDGGPEVLFCEDAAHLEALLRELAGQGLTNVLVEAGGGLVGRLLAAGLVDQVLVFVAPTLLGDDNAMGPARGLSRDLIADATPLRLAQTQRIGDDVLLDYRLSRDLVEG